VRDLVCRASEGAQRRSSGVAALLGQIRTQRARLRSGRDQEAGPPIANSDDSNATSANPLFGANKRSEKARGRRITSSGRNPVEELDEESDGDSNTDGEDMKALGANALCSSEEDVDAHGVGGLTQQSRTIEEVDVENRDRAEKRRVQRLSRRDMATSLKETVDNVLREPLLPSERLAIEEEELNTSIESEDNLNSSMESENSGKAGRRRSTRKSTELKQKANKQNESRRGPRDDYNEDNIDEEDDDGDENKGEPVNRTVRVEKQLKAEKSKSHRSSPRKSMRHTRQSTSPKSSLPTVDEDEEEEVDQDEVLTLSADHAVDNFQILVKLAKHDDKKILDHICSYLTVRQVVELSFLSTEFLEATRGMALHLEYLKRTFELQTLEQVFNDYYQTRRMTPWKVAGLYTAINDLSTLFQVIDAPELKFLGIVNPSLKSIKDVPKCTTLERFELHSCERVLDLSPLLELKDTLHSVSLLACREICDISLLGNLPKLRLLSTFKSNNVEALPSLRRCRNLELLSIGECVNISEIRSVRLLSNLRVLDVSFVRCITSLSFLRNAKYIRVLILDSCKNLQSISDLEHFGGNLQVLRLNGIMSLGDISGVRHCKNLTSLELGDLVHLKDLSPLASCPKLQDLLLLNCVSLTTLEPLYGSSNVLKRLIMNGCINLKRQEDAKFIDSCPNLVVFECERCSPTFLVLLLLSSRVNILAAAESKVAGLTQADIMMKSFPMITEKLDEIATVQTDTEKCAVLIMLQAFCNNKFALDHMVSAGVLERMFQLLIRGSAWRPSRRSRKYSSDSTHATLSNGEELLSRSVRLEVLRVVSTMSRQAIASDKLMRIKRSVEFLSDCMAESCLNDDMERITFEQENIVSEAAKALALLLENSGPTNHGVLVDRLLKNGVLRVGATVILKPNTLDQTRRPVLVLIKEMVDSSTPAASEAIAYGLIPATITAMAQGSTETRVVGMALLATLSINTPESTTQLIIESEGIMPILVKALRTVNKDLVKHVATILWRVPSALHENLVRTPGLVSALLTCMLAEIASKKSQGHISGQHDNKGILRCAQVFEKLSFSKTCIKLMVQEEEEQIEDTYDSARGHAAAGNRRSGSQRKSLEEALQGGRNSFFDDNEERYSSWRSSIDLDPALENSSTGDADKRKSNKHQSTSSQSRSRTHTLNSYTSRHSQQTMIEGSSEHPYRVAADQLGELFSTALMNGSTRSRASVARTVINFVSASEPVREAMFEAFTQVKQLSTLFDLVVRSAGKGNDIDVALELLHIFVQSPAQCEALGKVPITSAYDFARAVVNIAENPKSNVKWSSGVVSYLLGSSLKKLMLDSVVTVIVSAIDKRKSRPLQTLVLRVFDRRSVTRNSRSRSRSGQSRTSFDEPEERTPLYEFSKKRVALRFLCALLIDNKAPAAANVLVSQNRLESLFLSLNGPDADIAEYALRILTHIVRNKESFEDTENIAVYEQLSTDIVRQFMARQTFGIGCLYSLLKDGNCSTQVSAVELLRTLCKVPELGKLVMSQAAKRLSVESERGSLRPVKRNSTRGRGTQMGFASLAGEGFEEDIQAQPSVRFSDGENSVISTESHRVSPSNRRVRQRMSDSSQVVFDVPFTQILLNYITGSPEIKSTAEDLDASGAYTASEEQHMESTCELIVTLSRNYSRQVDEFIIHPLVASIDPSVTSLWPESQQRVAALLHFLSLETSQVMRGMLENCGTFPILIRYFCDAHATPVGKHRSITAISNYINGDVEKLLELNEVEITSPYGSSSSFLRELLRELHEGADVSRESLLSLLHPIFQEPISSSQKGAKSAQVKLAALLVDYGIADNLGDWQRSIFPGHTSIKSTDDIEYGRVLMRPLLMVAATNPVVAERLKEFQFVELFVRLYLTDQRQQMREAYSRILVELDERFLYDDSDVFNVMLAQDPEFESLLADEYDFECQQLEQFPAAFQRVRGYPSPIVHEDITRIAVEDWCTMAIKKRSIVGMVKLIHPKLYYEVEVVEAGQDAVFGWISDKFKTGVLQGFSKFGVGDDKHSWGISPNIALEFEAYDVLGLAADLQKNELTFTRNGKLILSQPLPSNLEVLFPAVTAKKLDANFNFGSQPFQFSPPSSGFRAVYRCFTT